MIATIVAEKRDGVGASKVVLPDIESGESGCSRSRDNN